MNKEKYLARIKGSGDHKPDLNTLKKLQKSHLLNIPFENLDIHDDIPIVLDINSIFKKVVEHKRGGFCYELNGLFFELLASLNFNAKRVSARVYDNENGYGKEFDHFAIICVIDDDEYLCDVGFGEFTFEPLKLEIGVPQNDARGDFLIDKYDENYLRVNKIINGTTIPEYIFQKEKRELKDYQKMCLYHQSNPDSHFTKNRLISIPTETGRITITGNILKIKDSDLMTETEIKDEKEFQQVLRNLFNYPG